MNKKFIKPIDETSIEEMNIGIALFMGGKIEEVEPFPYRGKCIPCFFFDNKTDNPFPFHSLRYDSDWNWLMDVVEKIKSLQGEDGRGKVNYVVIIENEYVVISLGGEQEIVQMQADDDEKQIHLVHRAVYDFITWYNLGQI